MAAILMAAVLVFVGAAPGQGLSQSVGDTGMLAVSLVAAAACGRAARRGGPAARAWWWICSAALVWSFGEIAWTLYGLVTDHRYPFPSLADAGFLAYSVPAVVGLLLFPRARPTAAGLARTLLDAAVTATAVLFVSWSVVLGPLVEAPGQEDLARLTALCYPVVDVVVASVVLVLTMRQRPGSRLPWLLLAAGFVVLTLTDSTYVRLTFEGVTGVTGTVLAGGWMLAFLLMALAASVPRRDRPGRDKAVYALAQDLLPYVPVGGAAVLAASSLAEGGQGFLLATGVVLLLLVAARQVLIVFQNVTLTRELEEKVAQRTAELEGLAAIVDSSSEAIVGKDPDGVVMSWNPGAERVYGYAASEAVGRHHSFLIPDDQLPIEEEGFAAARDHGQTRTYETERIRRDGTLVPVSLTVFPVRGDHGIHGIATIGQDITERRRAQAEQARAREAALESSRLKSEFMATMSHEIRTPMNGVIGLAALLLTTPLDDAQRQYAEGIRTAGEALLALINDILDFSKLEAGRVRPDPTPFEPGQLVEEVAGLFAEQAHGKGLELMAHCAPGVPARVVGDSRALRQILLNLVANAVKFTADGEVAVLGTFDAEAAGRGKLRFEVRDTGIGIPIEQQQNVFDAFAQADASTTRRYGGTGLGLAICRQLAEALGGSIDLTSSPGLGSVFRVEVPVELDVAEPGSEEPFPAAAEVTRVLVVDDNGTNRLLLEHQLRAWGLRPTTVSGAEEALASLRGAAAEDEPFALALLDLCMPVMDGLELARAVADDATLAQVPMLLLTSAGAPSAEELRRAGIHSWLAKPVRAADLRRRIARVLGRGPVPGSGATAGPAPARPGSRGRILVAEDNRVNQLVAKSMAERLGFTVDVVDDGAAAVDATARTRYAAVLMDCHMPVMDGFAATAAIRARGRGTGAVPIIAMTAGVFSEDRQRCLDAGMDDYLPKPVDLASLEAALDRWTTRSSEDADPGAGRAADGAHSPGPGQVLDPDRLAMLQELGILEQAMEAFRAEAAGSLEGMRTEGRAAQSAHRLKGSAGNIGAATLARLCQQIEDSVTTGVLPDPIILADVEAELARVLRASSNE